MLNQIKYILAGIIFTACSAAHGGATFMYGQIRDMHGNPMPNVRITSESGALDGATNSQGYFFMHDPTKGMETVKVIHEDPVKYPFESAPANEARQPSGQ